MIESTTSKSINNRVIAKLASFYPILDTGLLGRAEIDVTDAAAPLLNAGAKLLQLRHKGHFSRDLFEKAEQIASLCRSAGALFVVNDRADMAALLGAALHLGQDDIAPSDARKVVPNALIGFSTHNRAQLEAAANEPVDYLAVGPIFQTGSKINPDPVVGLEGLRALRPLTSRPIVAIGGITRLNADSVFDAGADSVAVIADLLPDLAARAAEWVALINRRGVRHPA